MLFRSDIGAQAEAEAVVPTAIGFARRGQDRLLNVRAIDPAVAEELARVNPGEAANQMLLDVLSPCRLGFLPVQPVLPGNHDEGEIEIRGGLPDPLLPKPPVFGIQQSGANGLEAVEEEDRSHGPAQVRRQALAQVGYQVVQ